MYEEEEDVPVERVDYAGRLSALPLVVPLALQPRPPTSCCPPLRACAKSMCL
jgi:hypothetical protein